jgi:hypothetical protein
MHHASLDLLGRGRRGPVGGCTATGSNAAMQTGAHAWSSHHTPVMKRGVAVHLERRGGSFILSRGRSEARGSWRGGEYLRSMRSYLFMGDCCAIRTDSCAGTASSCTANRVQVRVLLPTREDEQPLSSYEATIRAARQDVLRWRSMPGGTPAKCMIGKPTK